MPCACARFKKESGAPLSKYTAQLYKQPNINSLELEDNPEAQLMGVRVFEIG